MAGFFDGEGCVCLSRTSTGYRRLVVTLAQTDKDTVYAFKNEFGGYVRERTSENYKTIWEWAIEGRANTQTIYEALRPFLRIKDKQFEQKLALYDDAPVSLAA